jgi:hypothetical protein
MGLATLQEYVPAGTPVNTMEVPDEDCVPTPESVALQLVPDGRPVSENVTEPVIVSVKSA